MTDLFNLKGIAALSPGLRVRRATLGNRSRMFFNAYGVASSVAHRVMAVESVTTHAASFHSSLVILLSSVMGVFNRTLLRLTK